MPIYLRCHHLMSTRDDGQQILLLLFNQKHSDQGKKWSLNPNKWVAIAFPKVALPRSTKSRNRKQNNPIKYFSKASKRGEKAYQHDRSYYSYAEGYYEPWDFYERLSEAYKESIIHWPWGPWKNTDGTCSHYKAINIWCPQENSV